MTSFEMLIMALVISFCGAGLYAIGTSIENTVPDEKRFEFNLRQWLDLTKRERVDQLVFRLKVRPYLVCADGFKMSVQASTGHYSSPRDDRGPYDRVEVLCEPDPLLTPYSDTCDGKGPFAYVPLMVVERVIAKHGGIKVAYVEKPEPAFPYSLHVGRGYVPDEPDGKTTLDDVLLDMLDEVGGYGE